MEDQYHCILDSIMPRILLDAKTWTEAEMIQIENHFSTGNCPKALAHFSLKDQDKEKGGLSSLLLHACKVGRSESVRNIIEVWGADIQATATHFLEEQTAKDMGLRVNALLGVTPLLIAALYNRRKVARYLIAKGADVSARTSANNEGPFAGITPIHAALLHLSFCPDERCSRMVTKIIRSNAIF